MAGKKKTKNGTESTKKGRTKREKRPKRGRTKRRGEKDFKREGRRSGEHKERWISSDSPFLHCSTTNRIPGTVIIHRAYSFTLASLSENCSVL